MTLTAEQRELLMAEFKNALDLLYIEAVEHDGRRYNLLIRDKAYDYFEDILSSFYIEPEK